MKGDRLKRGFPGGSDSKESTCSVGDLGSIPGLGRSSGEGRGYPLQYSGLGNSMDVHGEGKCYSSILAWRIQMTEEPGGLRSMRLQRVIGENWCLRVEWTLKVLWSSAPGEASVCSACPFQEASSLGSNKPQ